MSCNILIYSANIYSDNYLGVSGFRRPINTFQCINKYLIIHYRNHLGVLRMQWEGNDAFICVCKVPESSKTSRKLPCRSGPVFFSGPAEKSPNISLLPPSNTLYLARSCRRLLFIFYTYAFYTPLRSETKTANTRRLLEYF